MSAAPFIALAGLDPIGTERPLGVGTCRWNDFAARYRSQAML
jgi:hypothetical protein